MPLLTSCFTMKHALRFITFAASFAVGCAMFTSGLSAEVRTRPPNIVFLLADDWGWGDLGCHGGTQVATPNLDRLAREGTDFRQFYTASPVCSPSRTAFMNGVFPARLSVRGPIGRAKENRAIHQVDWVDPQAVCLPRLLKDAGYATGHYGKWHLSGTSRDAPVPAAYGIDEHALFEASPARATKTDHVKMFDEAVAFVQRHRDRPFFLNVWIHETHLPHYPLEEDVKAHAHRGEQQAVYAAVVAAGDRGMGRVLDAIREAGLERDTIVIFSSDNGPEHTSRVKDKGEGLGSYYSTGSTGGLRGGKRSLHEGGVRLPFIVRWPGRIPAGRMDEDTVIGAVDLLPTLCAAGGVALPQDFQSDGENMLPALLGKVAVRTKPLFWDWHGKERGELPDGWPRWAVRDGDWKLLTDNAGRRELYNIRNDKLESKNLAAEHPDIAGRLAAALDAWKATLPANPPAKCIAEAPRK